MKTSISGNHPTHYEHEAKWEIPVAWLPAPHAQMFSLSVAFQRTSSFWRQSRLPGVTWLLPLLLSLTLCAAAQAQFNYTVNSGTSITITGYTGPGGAVSIPSTIAGLPVALIGGSSFYFLQSITSVTIPNSVTSIGDSAFMDCCNMTSVTISNSVTSIGDFAFYDCYDLTSVTIPTASPASETRHSLWMTPTAWPA